MVTTSGYRRGWLRPARRTVVDPVRDPVAAQSAVARRAKVGHLAAVRRPAALPVGAGLFVLAAAPFVLLAGAATGVPTERWLPVVGQWPTLSADQHGYRLLGAGLAVLAVGYLVLAVRAGLGSWSARTWVTVLTGGYDSTLFLVLLADPRPGWLLLGAAVLLVSLAGVVLCHQPDVDRYLAERGR